MLPSASGYLRATRFGVLLVSVTIGTLCLSSCGGDNASSNPSTPPATSPNSPSSPSASFTIGGTVTGLIGGGLTLQDDAGDDLVVNADGHFTFVTPIATGAVYAVTVKAQPTNPPQTCSVNAAAGIVQNANVDNVAVVCSLQAFHVGGIVSGMTGKGLVLQDNAGDDLTIDANGTFTFRAPVALGANYAVTVKSPPFGPLHTCTVNAGAGTVTNADVTSVSVSCAPVVPHFAYVSNAWDGTLSIYAINTVTGALSSPGGPPFAVGPSPLALTIDAAGKFVFLIDGANRTLAAYGIDRSTGALSLAPGSPSTISPSTLTDVAVDPASHFVFVTNAGGFNTVSAFSLASNGALSPVAGSPFATAPAPVATVVDPASRFLYVLGLSGAVAVHAIDNRTGVLSQIAGSPFAAGSNPLSIAIEPRGKFAYVVDNAASAVLVFAINGTTGALAPAGQVSTQPGAQVMAVDPSGRFIYVGTAFFDGVSFIRAVSTYGIDAQTGALTAIGALPVSYSPDRMTVDPSGSFLYVTSAADNSINTYAINATTGALNSNGGVATGSNPQSVAAF